MFSWHYSDKYLLKFKIFSSQCMNTFSQLQVNQLDNKNNQHCKCAEKLLN